METDDTHDQDEEYTDRQSMLDFSSSHRRCFKHIDKDPFFILLSNHWGKKIAKLIFFELKLAIR